MRKFIKHFAFITKHRFCVFLHCARCGLLWRGLVHDLSKYRPSEFFEGIKYYNGKRSPITECRAHLGYSKAVIHHVNRNKHHIDYWYNRGNRVQVNMPYKYAVECVCDKIAATKCYKGKEYRPEMVLEHWLKHGLSSHAGDNLKQFFTQVFTDLVNNGEKFVLRRKYLKQKYNEIVLQK